MEMTFRRDFLKLYLGEAPVPLATERSLECEILSKQRFVRPILDIGCGEGLFARILFVDKVDVGIDPNPKELERASTYGSYEELIQCMGDKIPKPDGMFNTIFSNSVIEHIKDIDPVLDEMHRLLNIDGDVYLTVPTNLFEEYTVANQLLTFLGLRTFAKKFRRFFNGFWKHYHCYSKEDWVALLEKHGFKIENSIRYGSRKFCSLNDFLSPLCLLSFLTKKLTNQWFMFPSLEKRILPIKQRFFGSLINKNELELEKSGLIFFHLKKNA